jgi:hypothetical protein
MEVEDEDTILERLFFKKYGRALPEPEKEKDEVDINFVIDLTDDKEEMEVETPAPVVVVKTEPVEISSDPNASAAAKVLADRKERRELVKGRKALIAFGKTLRKSNVISEKEAPIPENVVADSNVSADASVATVEQTIAESEATIAASEAAIAETNAAMAANQKEFEVEFGDTPLDEFDVEDESEFRLYATDKDVIDDDDAMIDDI